VNDQAPVQEAVVWSLPTGLGLLAPPTQNCAKSAVWSEENIPVGERQESTIDQLPTTSPPQGVTCPQAAGELPLQLAAEIQAAQRPTANNRFIVSTSSAAPLSDLESLAPGAVL
jgi:hypothetical protein